MKNYNNCPICLDKIKSNSGYIIMPCCNNYVHLYCIKQWYEHSPTNICFLCNQLNNIYNNIFFNNIIISTKKKNSSLLSVTHLQVLLFFIIIFII